MDLVSFAFPFAAIVLLLYWLATRKDEPNRSAAGSDIDGSGISDISYDYASASAAADAGCSEGGGGGGDSGGSCSSE